MVVPIQIGTIITREFMSSLSFEMQVIAIAIGKYERVKQQVLYINYSLITI